MRRFPQLPVKCVGCVYSARDGLRSQTGGGDIAHQNRARVIYHRTHEDSCHFHRLHRGQFLLKTVSKDGVHPSYTLPDPHSEGK